MPDHVTLDYTALRERFPWMGLADEPDMPAAVRHREVMARARIDREAMEAVDAVRHTA